MCFVIYCNHILCLLGSFGMKNRSSPHVLFKLFSPLNASLAEQKKTEPIRYFQPVLSSYIYRVIEFSRYNQQFKLSCQYFYCKYPVRMAFSKLVESHPILLKVIKQFIQLNHLHMLS